MRGGKGWDMWNLIYRANRIESRGFFWWPRTGSNFVNTTLRSRCFLLLWLSHCRIKFGAIIRWFRVVLDCFSYGHSFFPFLSERKKGLGTVLRIVLLFAICVQYWGKFEYILIFDFPKFFFLTNLSIFLWWKSHDTVCRDWYCLQ